MAVIGEAAEKQSCRPGTKPLLSRAEAARALRVPAHFVPKLSAAGHLVQIQVGARAYYTARSVTACAAALSVAPAA